MLAIKFKRIGKKHQASFRVVVAERRSKLQGRSVEDLGWVNPLTKKVEIKKDRIQYWLGVGAQPTPTVWNVLVKAGIVEGKKIAVHKKSKAKPAPATAEATAGKEAAAAPAAAPSA
ncbi:MAG: 30S ribosomal protein S16 [Candidatus Jorgensenbacteria bacterium]